MESQQQSIRNYNNLPPPAICPKCGLRYDPRRPACPRCGTKNQINDNNTQQKKPKSKNKTTVIVAIVVISLVAIAIIATNSVQTRKVAAYKNKIADFIMSAATAGENIEKTTDVVRDVWYSTIFGYKKAKTEVGKTLAIPADNNPDYDFNSALDILYSTEEFMNLIEICRRDHDAALEKLKELSNPPEKFEAIYSKARYTYDQLDNAMVLLDSPRGTYESYSKELLQGFTDISNGLRSIQNEIELIN